MTYLCFYLLAALVASHVWAANSAEYRDPSEKLINALTFIIIGLLFPVFLLFKLAYWLLDLVNIEN